MMLPTCREVSRCLAEGALETSPWHRRLLVRLHLSMCAHCSRFARQLRLLGRAWRERFSAPPPERLEALKRRLQARLKNFSD